MKDGFCTLDDMIIDSTIWEGKQLAGVDIMSIDPKVSIEHSSNRFYATGGCAPIGAVDLLFTRFSCGTELD